MSKSDILYAPGLGKDYKVLATLREHLRTADCRLSYVDFPYDEGELHPLNYGCIINNTASWWLGISLGASLLYYLYNYAVVKPERLTLINPFADRGILAGERGFDMAKQWNFAPKDTIVQIKQLDLVASVYDKSIPMHHGLELINQAQATIKNIIYVDSDHQLGNAEAQMELAQCLLSMGTAQEEKHANKYCHVYQWLGTNYGTASGASEISRNGKGCI